MIHEVLHHHFHIHLSLLLHQGLTILLVIHQGLFSFVRDTPVHSIAAELGAINFRNLNSLRSLRKVLLASLISSRSSRDLGWCRWRFLSLIEQACLLLPWNHGIHLELMLGRLRRFLPICWSCIRFRDRPCPCLQNCCFQFHGLCCHRHCYCLHGS